jgi:hypothetical protein
VPCPGCVLIVFLIDDEQDVAGLLAGCEKMTDFNLSDLKTKTAYYNYGTDCYLEEDVKEFIRLLKDEIKPSDTENPYLLYSHIIQKIDELAGDKLK